LTAQTIICTAFLLHFLQMSSPNTSNEGVKGQKNRATSIEVAPLNPAENLFVINQHIPALATVQPSSAGLLY